MPQFVVWLVLVMVLAGCENQAKTNGSPGPRIEGEAVVFPRGSAELAALVSEPVAARKPPPARLNGRLVWNEDRTVRLYSPFAGKVARILVQPGERVAAGQTLALIASPDFGQAQAEARRAESDYALAQQNLNRMRELVQNGVAARKDLNAAEAEHARAEAELQRARARVRLYGSSAHAIDQLYALKSPLSGVVVEKNINPGQELRPDQMVANAPALFVITDPEYLWAQLDAGERDLPKLKPGKTILVRTPAYPDESFEAKITAIADFFDPVTRTIKVRAALGNPQRRLKGEMFITAEVDHDTALELQVPAKAVFFAGERHFVFTDDGGGKYVRREVKTGDAYDGTVTVLAGLSQGQRVVTIGPLLLQQVLQPRRVMK